ncbi:WD40 repeat domain-containing protein [Candidatus Venteria ishoeyi]|uniref:WD domain, G-beta repeat n=1 Tax=Candidatus Venteria ishoeyi TaxID=1899563 RepID=A0A1H6F658_9GAMM|nr:hypothetical protein [Candidatus Venteria ishoeyi]SEH05023.1 WD domain%2C G-beta repeat [Candidatus Venteria ishoeyi]
MLKQKLYVGLGLLCCLWQGVVAEVISEPLYSFPPEERLVGHTFLVTAVAYSPDGSQIVSSSMDGSLKIWDAGNGAELMTFSEHTDSVRAVAYSPDGTRIVSGGDDHLLKNLGCRQRGRINDLL